MVFTTVNYIEHFLNLISAFASLLGNPIEITRCAKSLKICAITTLIRKYKSIINKKKKKHDKIVLLAESKLNSIEVLISEALIYSNISHDKFFNKKCAKRISRYGKRNQKFNDLNSLLKILVY